MAKKKNTVIVIGEGESGKTALIDRLFGDSFAERKKRHAPLFMREASETTDTHDFLELKGDSLVIGHYLKPSTAVYQFYQPSHLIVCVDLSHEFDTQKSYLESILATAAKSKIILVGTKCDQEPRLVRRTELEAFAETLKETHGHDVSIHEVSAKNNSGMDSIKKELADAAAKDMEEEMRHDKIAPLFKGIESKITELLRRYRAEKSSAPYKAAEALSTTLKDVKEAYVTGTITATELKEQCKTAIEGARPVFGQHRGWHGLSAMLRGFIGVLATISVIPAVAVALATKHGYKDTFFDTPKTDSEVKLDKFKEEVERGLDDESGKGPRM